jgi:hypothetical protein
MNLKMTWTIEDAEGQNYSKGMEEFSVDFFLCKPVSPVNQKVKFSEIKKE